MGSDSGEIHFEDFSAFMHVYFEVNMEKSKTNKSALKKLASQNQKHGTRTRPMYKGKPLDIQDLMLLKRTFNSRHAHGGELLTESSFGRRLLEIAPHFQGHVKDLYMKVRSQPALQASPRLPKDAVLSVRCVHAHVCQHPRTGWLRQNSWSRCHFAQVLNHVDGTINFPKLIRELFCPGAAPHEMVHLMSTIWPSFKQRIDDGRKYVLATAFDLFCPTFDPIYGSEMDQRQLGRMLQALGYNVPTAKMLVEAGMNHARSPEPGVRVLCFAAFFPWYRQELAFIKMQRAHRATVGLDSNKIYKPSPSDVISAFMSETRKKHAQDDDS